MISRDFLRDLFDSKVGFADASSLQLSGPGKGHMRQSTGVAQFSKGNWEDKSAAHVFLTVYTILPSPVVLPAPAAIEGFFILSDVFLLANGEPPHDALSTLLCPPRLWWRSPATLDATIRGNAMRIC